MYDKDEDNHEEEVLVEDDFDSSWDEEEIEADEDGENQDDLDDEQDESEEVEAEEQSDTGEESAADESEEADDDNSLDEKEIQRKKSWEGRLAAREREIEAREQALLNKQKPEEKPPETDDPAEDESDSALFEDFPELDRVLDRRVKPLQEQLQATTRQLEESRAQQELENHFSAIRAEHPDFEEVAQGGDLQSWIEAQPYSKAVSYMEAYQQGSAEQVNSLLTDFKSSRANKAKSEKRQQQIQDFNTPRGKSKVNQRMNAKDDFDSAWDEDD